MPRPARGFFLFDGKLKSSDTGAILKPARYDITVYQRATFRRRFKLPFNCSGHTVESQIWSARRVKKLIQFTVEWIDQADGLFDLMADSSQTSTTIKNGNWDLMVVYPNGDRFYWVEGDVVFDPGYTEPVHA